MGFVVFARLFSLWFFLCLLFGPLSRHINIQLFSKGILSTCLVVFTRITCTLSMVLAFVVVSSLCHTRIYTNIHTYSFCLFFPNQSITLLCFCFTSIHGHDKGVGSPVVERKIASFFVFTRPTCYVFTLPIYLRPVSCALFSCDKASAPECLKKRRI